MRPEDILLLDNEVKFLVQFRKVAKQANDTNLYNSLDKKLASVLPKKVREISLAFSVAQQDYVHEDHVRAARYCGRSF